MAFSVEIVPLRGSTEKVDSPRRFEKAEVTIGRLAGNDIVLPDQQVSSKHAKLYERGGKIFIIDLGSSNGTFMEERRLDKNVECEILASSRLLLGSYLLTARPEQKADAKKGAESKGNGAKAGEPKDPTVRPGKVPDDVLRLKNTIREQLIDRLDLRRKDILAISDQDLRSRAHKVVEDILVDLRWEIPQGLKRERLVKEILDEALALGPLEELLADDDVSEVMLNRYDQIYAESRGQLSLTPFQFSSEQSVLAAIERILAPIGRRIDESSPMVDARLKDGSRVNAVIRPLALQGPCITIRKFPKHALTIDTLIGYKSVTRGMADFLKLAVESRLNLVISGGTGSGKTTLLNVVSSFIPDEQRVITVEDAAELKLRQEHVVSFETRPPNLEGKGAITIRDLVRNALRMRPDRIIVGECRGGEALDMLQAMNTGHDGSMTTGHANTPADMLRRLETMVLTSGIDLPMKAIREQIGSAVHLIVQQTRFACGTRKITAITEVLGLDQDEGVIILQDVFLFKQDGYGPDGRIDGRFQATGYVPKFFRKLQERGLPVSASVFAPGDIKE